MCIVHVHVLSIANVGGGVAVGWPFAQVVRVITGVTPGAFFAAALVGAESVFRICSMTKQ